MMKSIGVYSRNSITLKNCIVLAFPMCSSFLTFKLSFFPPKIINY